MNIIEHPSPNFDERGGQAVDMLVLHYTDTLTAQDAIDCLVDPTPGKRVSAHYLVGEDGTVWRMVAENMRAWHAGVSQWRGHTNVNARSIGIEIVNPGHQHGYRAFPPEQMEAVATLCREIIARHHILEWNVVGHSDVAPERKRDPGELFDWQWMAMRGIGLWPYGGWWRNPLAGIARFFVPEIRLLQRRLAAYGYNLPVDGEPSAQMIAVITAFQRHFRARRVNGRWDSECDRLLNTLLAHAPSAIV
jgi:N-acetylmuramoyl-L-alanine amidase